MTIKVNAVRITGQRLANQNVIDANGERFTMQTVIELVPNSVAWWVEGEALVKHESHAWHMFLYNGACMISETAWNKF